MGTANATVRSDAGVSVAIQMAATVTAVQVRRYDPNGFETVIRAGESMPLTNGFGVYYDYEAPLDVVVHYEISQVAPAGAETAKSNDVTVVSNGISWLKDPGVPTRNLPVFIVTSIPELTRPARAGVFQVVNRTAPVVVSSMRQAEQGEITFHTTTDVERSKVEALIRSGQVLLFQSPGTYGWGSRYIHVGDVVEARVGVAMEPMRRWVMPFIVVDRPAGLASAPVGASWNDGKVKYPTWDALKASKRTWESILVEGV